MAVQINVAANQAALTASIQAGVQAYNQKFAQNNQVNLSVNQRAFSQPLGRMTGDVKDFEAALAASNARVIAFGASTAVLGGVIRSFKELANVTIDVEKNLADINRVFGLTTGQLQKFSTDLFSVGKQTASTFDDASKAALEFSRQGLKAEEVLIRTKDALTLARVAGISTANSVDALTSTINGFAATGVTTTQILNKLVAVEQDFAVGAGDLAEALSRTGQAAQEAGVSLDQLNALVTAAQQSTARGGAVIGNALKTIFTRLQRTETLDQLEAFNVAVRDVQGNTLPAVTILQNFAGAYKGLADAQRAQLSEQVAGVYQVNILKAIVGDLNKSQGVYAGALQRGASATNEAEVATAKLNQTLDALLKQTATSTQQLANNIGKVTFEPLARYGTEQLKSLVESMNEILEGEGVGSTFANGLLKGIRNVIAGPGAIAAFFTLFKLIQNSFTYLAQALPQIAGITTETQNRKNIEQSILQIMQQQGPVSQALAGSMGNQAAQAQLLLQLARQQTAEYQIQSTLAKQLATQLAGQGVRVKGSGGLQVTRAGGYIPNATRMAEAVGAQAGGYAPGKVVKSPVGGVMNTAEDVKYVPGFAQPFINPPAGSKAGRAHRQNAISRTGVDPYMNSGFIPNFGNPKNVIDKSYTGHLNLLKIDSLKEKEQIQEVADLETEITNKLGKKEVINDKITGFGIKYDIEEIKGKSNATYRKEAADLALSGNIAKIKESMPANKTTTFNATQWTENLKDLKDKGIDLSLSNIKNLSQLENGVPSLVTGKTVEFGRQFTGLLNALSGEAFEKDITIQKKGVFSKSRNNARLDFESLNKLYSGGEAKLGGITLGNLVAKAIESTGRKYENGEEDKIAFSKSIKLFVPEEHKLLNKGFIPNFAPPISMLRIPWFKKYANPSFDAKQPTLNIAGANAVDTFRSTQFRTNKTDYNKKAGDGNVFGPIYEKFVRSSISLQANKSKIKSLILGQSLEPDTIQGESSFDSFMELVNTNPTDLLDLVGIEIKGGPKDSQSGGSATGIITKKYNNFTTKNPKAAARLRELLGVFNEPGNPQHLQYMSALGKEFLPLAATNYDEIAKNSPELLKVLSQKTNELLTSYVNNPSFYRAEASGGFIPNFASMISSSIKGKGNISAIKTGKNNYEIEGVEVGKKFRGQGLGSQLYGSIAQKIGSGSTIKSVLLPQEQALADYASGKSIPAKAIFPQLSWAKMAKSSKLLINGKEIAMSDFENGIAGHKYNAAKLDMALIELVNSHASGFIPNFAYKQAVMGLEESMSGEKAVFDTKPFPHIRNKSQPTFSSAISDHGGLSNALSDSMRGQKAAGLMSKGYIPNFAPKKKGKRNQTQNTQSSFDFNQLQASAERVAQDALTKINNAYQYIAVFGANFADIIELTSQSTINKLGNATSKVQASVGNLSNNLTSSFSNISNSGNRFAKFSESLSKASTAISIAGPTIAGFAEEAYFGNKKRTEMTSGERSGKSLLSTGLSAVSTGVGIGSAFGLPGAIVGGVAGSLVALTSSINAASLSVDELTQLNEEKINKDKESLQSASSYIDNQKRLNELIASGASDKDIKEASQKLTTSFNDIKNIKLAEIFAKTGGSVEKMSEELNKFTEQVNRRQNANTALSNLQQGSGTLAQYFGFSDTTAKKGVKKPTEVAAQLFATSKSFGNSDLTDLMKTTVFEKTNEKIKKSIEIVKEIYPDVEQTSEEFENLRKAFSDLLFGASGFNIAQGLEKFKINDAVVMQISNFKKVATKSFAEIFRKIERDLNKNLFDIALSFEKDSSTRRIQSSILDFSTNFQDSINSFVSSNLPDIRKFDFAAVTAGQKAQMLLQKSQQDYDKAVAEQDNEKSNFSTKTAQELSGSFKSTLSNSQVNAEFYKNKVLPQIQSGNYSGDISGIISGLKEAQLAKVKETRSSAEEALGKEGFNFGSSEEIKKTLGDLAKILENPALSEEKKSKIIAYQQELINLQETTLKFANQAEKDKLSAILTEKAEAQTLFEQKQTNAKKELEINKQLNEARIAADKEISVAKARVDKDNLMRMEKMKDLSASIGNSSEIAKARSNANVNTMQRRLDDQRETYGMGRSQISERKFGIQADILKEQRAAEDAAINAEIQQRVLEMAAEQENTAATLKLNDTIMTLVESQLRGELGGTGKIEEINSLVNVAGYSGKQINDQFGPQSFEKYQAYKRIEESRTASAANNTGYNTSTFESNLSNAGFNDKMTQAEQLTFLEKEETAARSAGNIVLAGTIKRYQDQIVAKKQVLKLTRDDIDNQVKLNVEIEKVNNKFAGRLKKGLGNLKQEGDDLLLTLGENLPKMFADGLADGIKAAIKETDNLGDALLGVAASFLDSISTTLMQAGTRKLIGGFGLENLFTAQKGGVVRAQSGMYVSGTGSGDKYPAMLENGEYVLNRRAVMAMGGPASLDTLNFSAAPRFASGGAFNAELSDIKSMEDGMTTFGLENSSLYKELRDAEIQKAEQARQKKRARQAQTAQMVGSIVASIATIGIGAGISNKMGNIQAGKAQTLSAKLNATGGAGMTNSELGSLAKFQKSGLLGNNFEYKGPTNIQSGFNSFLSGPSFGPNRALVTKPMGRQTGGSIGSRLSDTIPAYMEGGLYNSPMVKQYGVGMQSGGTSAVANNSNTVNNSNASNSFNFNTSVNRDGAIQMGADSSTYKQQDVELSNNLNTKIYGAVLDVIREQQRFGGSLAGTRKA
jgi:TP901 family phage tail tape measure protein